MLQIQQYYGQREKRNSVKMAQDPVPTLDLPKVPALDQKKIMDSLQQAQPKPPVQPAPQVPAQVPQQPAAPATPPPTQPQLNQPQPPATPQQPLTKTDVDRQNMQTRQPATQTPQSPPQQPAQPPSGSPQQAPPADQAPGDGGDSGFLSNLFSGDTQKYGQMIAQFPQQANEWINGLTDQVTGFFKSDAGKAELAHGQKTGDVSPQMSQKIQDNMTKQGFGVEQIAEGFKSMSFFEKLAMGVGLGAGAIGLIQAFTGGGIGSWIMGLLGLGGAAFMASNSGMLGQGAQDLTQGLTNKVTGMFGPGESGEQKPSTMQSISKVGLPLLLNSPDAVSTPALRALSKMHPQLASKMDTAIGHGGMGNAFMSLMGDITGQRRKLMGQYGLNDKQQQELMRRWSLMRNG